MSLDHVAKLRGQKPTASLKVIALRQRTLPHEYALQLVYEF